MKQKMGEGLITIHSTKDWSNVFGRILVKETNQIGKFGQNNHWKMFVR